MLWAKHWRASGPLTLHAAREFCLRCDRACAPALRTTHCVHAVIALPSALYPTTSMPVALWIVGTPEQRDDGSVLLVDASQLGQHGRSRTELSDADISAIDSCYRTWRMQGEVRTSGAARAAAVLVSALLEGAGRLDPRTGSKTPQRTHPQRTQESSRSGSLPPRVTWMWQPPGSPDLHEQRAGNASKVADGLRQGRQTVEWVGQPRRTAGLLRRARASIAYGVWRPLRHRCVRAPTT